MEQISLIPIGQITADEQVRKIFDKTAIESLAASLIEVGQLQPIRVRLTSNGYRIVDGELRFRAASEAGLGELAAIIEEKELGTADVLQRQLVANCQRNDLTPLETANAISQLMTATRCNASEAAKMLSMSPATVTRLLALLKLPEELQAKVANGELAASAAYELTRISEPAELAEAAAKLTSGKLTRDGLRSARKKGPHDPDETKVSRVTAMLGDGRSVVVAGPELDLDQCIATLSQLLRKVRSAKRSGLSLQTLVNVLKDQNVAAPVLH